MSTLNQYYKELTQFFGDAVSGRRRALMSDDAPLARLEEWCTHPVIRSELLEITPLLQSCSARERGIHADAFIFDHAVVKTNLFGDSCHDGQMEWLVWCGRNQTNPLVPKIHLLIVDPETERYLVVMERLFTHSGFSPHAFGRPIDIALRDYFRRAGSTRNLHNTLGSVRIDTHQAIAELQADVQLCEEINDPDIADELLESIQAHERTLAYIADIERLVAQLLRTHRSHFKRINRVFRLGRITGRAIDVHGHNWMLRANGQPVFLDPLN